MSDKNTFIGNGKKISGYEAFKGQINLDQLIQILKERPELKKKVKFKKGQENEMVDIEMWPKKPEHQSEHQTHSIMISKPYVKADNKEKDDLPF